MIRKLIAAIAMLLATVHAMAGVVYEGIRSGSRSDAQVNVKASISGDRLRIDVFRAGALRVSLIKAGDLLIRIDRTTGLATEHRILESAVFVSTTQASTDYLAMAAPMSETRTTARSESAFGVYCKVTEIKQDGQLQREVCMTESSRLPPSGSDPQTIALLSELLSAIAISDDPFLFLEGLPNNISVWRESALPSIVRTFEHGVTAHRFRLLQVSTIPLASDTFTVPRRMKTMHGRDGLAGNDQSQPTVRIASGP